MGEGLGVVVVKRVDDAERDGDTILAVIKSVGTSSDGKGDAIYAPSAQPPDTSDWLTAMQSNVAALETYVAERSP